MTEIALLGTTCRITSNIASALLSNRFFVHEMVDYPEKVMVINDRLAISHFDINNYDKLRRNLKGYTHAVVAHNDDLTNVYTNNLTLKHFANVLTTARDAGIRRIIVVGSPQSEAFFVSKLRGIAELDWVFISTEGNYPIHVVQELLYPKHHRRPYRET